MRFNVGSLLHHSIGTSRDYEVNLPSFQGEEELVFSSLRGTLRFTRTSEGLYLQGQLLSDAPLACDRCLSDITHQLEAELEELYLHPAGPGSDPATTIPETGWLNLEPLVRECLLLSIPSHPLCMSDCKGLCPVCGANRNEESCDHPETEIDPRFAALKSLLK